MEEEEEGIGISRRVVAGPRWSPDIKNGGGRLLVDLLIDLLDAHVHGEPRMELCHHYRGNTARVTRVMNSNHTMITCVYCAHTRAHTRAVLTYTCMYKYVYIYVYIYIYILQITFVE